MKNEILVAIGKVDKKVDKMQEEIQEIKVQVAKIPEIEKQVAKIPEIEKQVAKIPDIEKQVEKIQSQTIPELQQETRKIGETVEKMQSQTIPELQQETRNISRSVAVIEHEHGDKIKALFDAFCVNQEKGTEQDKKISFIEQKLLKHDQEIYYLNTKVQGL